MQAFTLRSVGLATALLFCLPPLASAQGGSSSRRRSQPQPTSSATIEESTDEREARALFDAGAAAYEQGRYEDALDRFRAAYDRHPHPLLQYNIGQAADHLRRDDEALTAFEAYLRDTPSDAPHRAEVERRVAVLREVTRHDATAAGTTASTNDAPPDLSPRTVALQENQSHPSDEPHARPITKKWWFWTTVVGVVALAVVIPIVVTRNGDSNGSGSSTAYPTGNTGATVFALQRGAR